MGFDLNGSADNGWIWIPPAPREVAIGTRENILLVRRLAPKKDLRCSGIQKQKNDILRESVQ